MIRTGKSSGTEKAPSEVYTVVHRPLVAHPSTMVSAAAAAGADPPPGRRHEPAARHFRRAGRHCDQTK